MAKLGSSKSSMQKSAPKSNNSDLAKPVLGDQGTDRLLKKRLELVEDLWETVLRSECPPEQTERLLRLKSLSNPISFENNNSSNNSSTAIVLLIREMDLAEAISAARAFSLYFQLVNILEQRIEEDSYLASMSSSNNICNKEDSLDPFAPTLASQTAPATFRELFERLRRLNVPPNQLEALLQEIL